MNPIIKGLETMVNSAVKESVRRLVEAGHTTLSMDAAMQFLGNVEVQVATTELDHFWNSVSKKQSPTQLERYEMKHAPESIKKFIAMGGGSKMGTTCEELARFKFNLLEKRSKGKTETGYDHLIKLSTKTIYVEQKSSGHWDDDDYKWQHVEDKHKWDMLLLCGIDYTNVKFWAMNRTTFNQLISEKRITNQGSKTGESYQGMWFYYSDVKDSLVEIKNTEEFLTFVNSL